MKKSILFVVVALAILVSMLPMASAFAANSSPYSKVTVNNRTGADVSLVLINGAGSRTYVSYPVGLVTYTNVLVGTYEYYINTPCGYQHGWVNFGRNKKFDLFCPKGDLSIMVGGPTYK